MRFPSALAGQGVASKASELNVSPSRRGSYVASSSNTSLKEHRCVFLSGIPFNMDSKHQNEKTPYGFGGSSGDKFVSDNTMGTGKGQSKRPRCGETDEATSNNVSDSSAGVRKERAEPMHLKRHTGYRWNPIVFLLILVAVKLLSDGLADLAKIANDRQLGGNSNKIFTVAKKQHGPRLMKLGQRNIFQTMHLLGCDFLNKSPTIQLLTTCL